MSEIPQDPSSPSDASSVPPATEPGYVAGSFGAPSPRSSVPAGDKPDPGWKAWAAAAAVAAVVAVGAGFALGHDASSPSGNAAGGANVATAGGAQAGANGQTAVVGQLPGGAGGGTSGTVTAIDDGTLTLKSADGTSVSVKTSSDTTVTEAKVGSIDDLEKGDHLLVMGAMSNGTVTAERIVDSGEVQPAFGPSGGMTPPSGGAPSGQPGAGAGASGGAAPTGGAAPSGQTGTGSSGGSGQAGPGFGPGGGMPTVGQITSIDGGTITLKGADGSTTKVVTSSATTVSVSIERKVADIAKGDTIVVRGQTAGAVVTAVDIRIGDVGTFGPGAGGAMGPGSGSAGATPPGAGAGSGARPTTTA